MKRLNIMGSKQVFFGAGKAFDAFGRATSFWTGVVQYRWDADKKTFHVFVAQALGTGTVTNSHIYNEEIKTCDELNKFLHNMKEYETHYKKVYGE